MIMDTNIMGQEYESPNTKLAVVTWAASGVGEAVSTLLAHKGYVVYGLDKDWEQEGIQNGVARVKADVSNLDEAKKALDDVLQMYPKVDVLVNITKSDFEDNESSKDIVESQFYNPVSIAEHAIDTMKNQNAGMVVNVSSLVPDQEENKNSPYYSSCKSALVSYGKAVKKDLLRHNVKICTVHPGPVRYRVKKTKGNSGAGDKSMDVAKIILRAVTSKSVLDLYTVGY